MNLITLHFVNLFFVGILAGIEIAIHYGLALLRSRSNSGTRKVLRSLSPTVIQNHCIMVPLVCSALKAFL